MLLRGGWRQRKEAQQSSAEDCGKTILHDGQRVEPLQLWSFRAMEPPSLWSLGTMEPASLWILGAVKPSGMLSLWAMKRPGLQGVIILRTSAFTP